MRAIELDLGTRSHSILIEDGLLDRAAEYLVPFARAGRLVAVSDHTVWPLLGPRLEAGVGSLRLEPVLIPAGERSKSWEQLREVVERLLDLGVERSDHIVAFGGGVVGDLAGLAAALTNRGCSVVQIPTTLLAQVDSSVGGKTAINTRAGKNLVGTFHQPALVLIDPSLLDSLHGREVRSGYAEIAKYALIGDHSLFDWLEENGAGLIAGSSEYREVAIAAAVSGKARIVAEDERERTGRRALLNLGHTFGHALEAETFDSRLLLHGEAVALGCVLAFAFSVERGLCPGADYKRVERHLAAVGLPTRLAALHLEGRGRQLAARMLSDKKRSNGRIPLILARGIGEALVDDSVNPSEIVDFLDRAA